jgi:hypothetical protein
MIFFRLGTAIALDIKIPHADHIQWDIPIDDCAHAASTEQQNLPIRWISWQYYSGYVGNS